MEFQNKGFIIGVIFLALLVGAYCLGEFNSYPVSIIHVEPVKETIKETTVPVDIRVTKVDTGQISINGVPMR
jgi:hypothetical protein